MSHKSLIVSVFVFWSVKLLSNSDGILYNTEFYLRVADDRGYVKQFDEGFVISNGLRSPFVFHKVSDAKNKVFIKDLASGKYLCANPDGRVTYAKSARAWEGFTVFVANNKSYTFKSIHDTYLMANLDSGIISLSPNPGFWESFSIERIYDKQGFDKRGFGKNGNHRLTNNLYDPRGYNQRGFNELGLPDFEQASKKHADNEYLRRQKENLNFIKQEPKLVPSATPNIYVIILDTMRADFVNEQTGPNLLQFKKDNVSSEIALAGSTTTHPSVYSLLSSRPSYEYYPAISSGYVMGSMPLNILKYKLGYALKATGKKDMGCLDFEPPVPYYPMSKNSYLVARQFRFGLQSHLLDDCVKNGLLGNEAIYRDGLKNLDENIFEHLEKIAADSPQKSTLFFAHLEGAHTPYVYSEKDEFKPGVFELESQRTYASAFHRTDRLFGQFIKNLKSKGLYNDALIVVLGDHGEVLPGEPLKEGDHGSYPIDKAQTRVPLYFKFPGTDNQKFRHITKVSTLADVFPTIFDYLGVSEKTEKFFTGRSIRDLKTHVVPVVRVNPDNEMAFYAYPYKLNVTYRPWAYTGSASMDQLQTLSPEDFEIGTLENFDDQLLEVHQPIKIDPRSLANFRNIFPALFKEHQEPK